MHERSTALYTGARVCRLIGRKDLLHDIQSGIRDPSGQTHVYYIEAPGGTGKTFLAREVLSRCRSGGEWARDDLFAASAEIDLYDYHAHSLEGFMSSFVGALGSRSDYFDEYRQQYEHLQRVEYNLTGAVQELWAEHQNLVNSFLRGCSRLGRDKRLVVAIDTFERLFYETDRIQEALGLSSEDCTIRSWLMADWLMQWRTR